MKKALLLGAAALTLGTASNAQSFVNSGFETWHNYNVAYSMIPPASLALEVPNGWNGMDSLITGITMLAGAVNVTIEPQKQVFKSTDAHEGTSAVELRSAFLGDLVGNAPGVLTNAKISIDLLAAAEDPDNILDHLTYEGGTEVNNRVDTVTAWIKLASTNMDNAAINVQAVRSEGGEMVTVGGGTLVIEPIHDEYVRVAVPVNYISNDTPQVIYVSFMSSDTDGDTTHAGNTLLVDDVAFTYAEGEVSIHQLVMSEQELLVYPNPASATLYFNLKAGAKADDFQLTISDISGRVISSEKMQQQINARNIADWAAGTYIYNLVNQKTGKSEQGKFIVQ
jgi:hypothetical protein